MGLIKISYTYKVGDESFKSNRFETGDIENFDEDSFKHQIKKEKSANTVTVLSITKI